MFSFCVVRHLIIITCNLNTYNQLDQSYHVIINYFRIVSCCHSYNLWLLLKMTKKRTNVYNIYCILNNFITRLVYIIILFSICVCVCMCVCVCVCVWVSSMITPFIKMWFHFQSRSSPSPDHNDPSHLFSFAMLEDLISKLIGQFLTHCQNIRRIEIFLKCVDESSILRFFHHKGM